VKGASIDVTIRTHGALTLVLPLSSRAADWIRERLPHDAPVIGGATVVQWWLAPDVARLMQSDGLRVHSPLPR